MRRLIIIILLCPLSTLVFPQQQRPQLEYYPHAKIHAEAAPAEVDYELGLGALQKVKNRWRLKHSERIKGVLERRTWQVTEGYTAEEAYQWYAQQLETMAELIYQCQGRSCGRSAKWADLIFQQRVLYGHDEGQHYGVWRIQQQEALYTVVLYAVDRSSQRHYVHLDLLQH